MVESDGLWKRQVTKPEWILASAQPLPLALPRLGRCFEAFLVASIVSRAHSAGL